MSFETKKFELDYVVYQALLELLPITIEMHKETAEDLSMNLDDDQNREWHEEELDMVYVYEQLLEALKK